VIFKKGVLPLISTSQSWKNKKGYAVEQGKKKKECPAQGKDGIEGKKEALWGGKKKGKTSSTPCERRKILGENEGAKKRRRPPGGGPVEAWGNQGGLKSPIRQQRKRGKRGTPGEKKIRHQEMKAQTIYHIRSAKR